MREKPNIADEVLLECLHQHYHPSFVTLEFLPRGQDTQAGAYRVVSAEGTAYFLKVSARLLYEPAYSIPRYLADQGIIGVVAPLPTKGQALWVQVGEWRIALYPFIESVSDQPTVASARHWYAVGSILVQIHQLSLPAQGLLQVPIRKESFEAQAYANWISAFETQPTAFSASSTSAGMLRASWLLHHEVIHTLLEALKKLAAVLQNQSPPQVICHADLHTNNLIITPDEQVFVVDWDEVMLAPKERDFIFISEENSAFFEGYGETELDWVALTYYRCEREVQDLIEYAKTVVFREDLGEQTRLNAVARFEQIFAKGGMLTSVYAAARHLPSNLVF